MHLMFISAKSEKVANEHTFEGTVVENASMNHTVPGYEDLTECVVTGLRVLGVPLGGSLNAVHEHTLTSPPCRSPLTVAVFSKAMKQAPLKRCSWFTGVTVFPSAQATGHRGA